MDAAPPAMAPQSSADFFDSRLERYSRQRVPLDGTIELTRRCNFDCVHCYIVEHGAKGEMTTEEVVRILEEIADAGCLYLLLTGGEILTRRDFVPIYTHAHRMGFQLTLYTNGMFVGKELVDVLRDRPPHSIEITLYGATEDTYAKVTRRPSALSAVLRGIDLLAEAGLPLALKTMALGLTEGEVEAMRSMTTSRGLKFRYDPLVQPRIDGNKAPCAYRLPPERVITLEKDDPAIAEEWRRQGRMFAGMSRSDRLFTCGAGTNSFHIDSRARLSVCTIVRTKMYDLRQGTFRDGWERWVPEIINRKLRPDQPCNGCKIFMYCDSCPGWAAMETGSEYGHVKHACDVAHLRAEAFPLLGKVEPTSGHGVPGQPPTVPVAVH